MEPNNLPDNELNITPPTKNTDNTDVSINAIDSGKRGRRIKKLSILVSVILVMSFAITVASAQSEDIRIQLQDLYKSISLKVDGKKVDNLKDSYVLVDDGKVMVPIDTLSKALGVNVNYDADTNEVNVITPNPIPEIKYHAISQLAVLRNVGPFYTSNDYSVSIAQKRFSSGLLVDNTELSKTEFIVKLDQQYKGFETYVGVEDSTQNSYGFFTVSFFADDRLLDSPSLRINEDNPVKPAQYARWLKFDGLENVKRLTVRVEFKKYEDDEKVIGEYGDLTAAFGNFNLILK